MSAPCPHPEAAHVIEEWSPQPYLRITCLQCGAHGVSEGERSHIRARAAAWEDLLQRQAGKTVEFTVHVSDACYAAFQAGEDVHPCPEGRATCECACHLDESPQP